MFKIRITNYKWKWCWVPDSLIVEEEKLKQDVTQSWARIEKEGNDLWCDEIMQLLQPLKKEGEKGKENV